MLTKANPKTKNLSSYVAYATKDVLFRSTKSQNRVISNCVKYRFGNGRDAY